MQEFIINVPDDKLAFFKELIKNLGFTQKHAETKNILSPRQIQLVEETRKEIRENPDSLSDWEDVLLRLDPKAC